MIKAFFIQYQGHTKNSIYLEYMGGNAEFFSVRADPDDYFQN